MAELSKEEKRDLRAAISGLIQYLKSESRVVWAEAHDLSLLMKACQLGICAALDDMPEDEKKKELQRRQDVYAKQIRICDQDAITVFTLERLAQVFA